MKIRNGGYSLSEVLVTLLILGLMAALTIPGQIKGQAGFQQMEFERECEMIYYDLLQYQNDALMDGYRRQLRFLEGKVSCLWTKNKIPHTEILAVEHISFGGNFTGSNALTLSPTGTVSRGGAILLINKKNGKMQRIIIQVGNGRIYLED